MRTMVVKDVYQPVRPIKRSIRNLNGVGRRNLRTYLKVYDFTGHDWNPRPSDKKKRLDRQATLCHIGTMQPFLDNALRHSLQ
jgi:hypothetical protein